MNEEKIKKLILELKDLDGYERDDVVRMLKSQDAFITLGEIGNQIFRPARKHGYPDKKIADCLEKCGDCGEELISLLEDKFYELLKDRNLLDYIY